MDRSSSTAAPSSTAHAEVTPGATWSTLTLAVDAGGAHGEALRWIARHPDVERIRIVPADGAPSARSTSAHADDGTVASVRAVCPDVEVTVDRRGGPVVDALVDASAADDLLVIGSLRSRRGATLGRMPGRVAERALVPVVVVPDDPHLVDGDVVLAVDEPLDERALRIAVDEAVRHRKRLTLVRAWEMPVVTRTGLTDFAEDPLRWRRINAELLERATDQVRARFPEVRTHPLLVEGHPGRAIADHSRRASLVVLGQGHVHVLSGSVLHDLLRAARSPVCVVPSGSRGD